MAPYRTLPRLFLILAAACLTHTPIRVAAQETPTFQERLEYDPATAQWKEIAPPIPGTDEGDLALARTLLARGEYPAARKAFAQWFKSYPDSPHRPEGLFYAAETEIMAVELKPKGGDLIKAYEWLEELLEGWHGTELGERAIRKEIIIAELFLYKNRKQKVWRGLLWLSAHEEALKILDKIIDDWARDTPVAEQALRLKADYHYGRGEFDEAEEAYARLVRDFPRGRYHKFALLRSGESAFARFPGVLFDSADLVEAEVYFTDYQQRFPQESNDHGIPQKLNRIRESQAQKEYLVGRYYERTRAIDAAAYYYRLVLHKWPATTWAAEARNRLIAMGAGEAPAESPADD